MENKRNVELKSLVKEKYGQIAQQDKTRNSSSCCGSGECGPIDYTIMADDYSKLGGYEQGADLGLGCGLPTEHALINPGDTVVDLGSGAGNDCFVARSIAGDTGRVIGVDFTEAMVTKARANAAKVGYTNVEFRQGDIEDLPLADGIADVVVSNCVFNLVPDKKRAFAETFRVLRPGGHFSISDIVLSGELPTGLKESAEMYAGCVAGAIQKDAYLQHIADAGFTGIRIQKEKRIEIPDEILLHYVTADQLESLKSGASGIFSITVYGEKAGQCCAPGCCN